MSAEIDVVVNCASHLTDVLRSPERLNEAIAIAEKEIRGKLNMDDLHAIAVSGVSGLVLGTAIALRLHKHMIVVRKAQESRHSDRVVEGVKFHHGSDRLNYIIVDDLMSSGFTVARMQVEIDRHTEGQARFCGIYLYFDSSFTRVISDDWARCVSTQKEKYIRSLNQPKPTPSPANL